MAENGHSQPQRPTVLAAMSELLLTAQMGLCNFQASCSHSTELHSCTLSLTSAVALSTNDSVYNSCHGASITSSKAHVCQAGASMCRLQA